VDDGDIADPKRSFFSNEMRSEGIVEIVSVIFDDLGRGVEFELNIGAS
jgi:hypothetical protein